jgi:hypothetical protein
VLKWHSALLDPDGRGYFRCVGRGGLWPEVKDKWEVVDPFKCWIPNHIDLPESYPASEPTLEHSCWEQERMLCYVGFLS